MMIALGLNGFIVIYNWQYEWQKIHAQKNDTHRKTAQTQ